MTNDSPSASGGKHPSTQGNPKSRMTKGPATTHVSHLLELRYFGLHWVVGCLGLSSLNGTYHRRGVMRERLILAPFCLGPNCHPAGRARGLSRRSASTLSVTCGTVGRMDTTHVFDDGGPHLVEGSVKSSMKSYESSSEEPNIQQPTRNIQ